jgi:hypothetical protein
VTDPAPLPEVDLDSDTPGLGIVATTMARILGDVPPEVFHYTSAQGLMGIVGTVSIWATDTRFLNDKTEFVHGREICVDELANPRLEGLFGEICRSLSSAFEAPDFVFFTASFCEADDLVPQWRGYGANGAGYAIGLATPQLARLYEHFSLLRVHYTDEAKRAAVQKLINGFSSAWENAERTRRGQREPIATAIATALLTGLTLLSLSFKPEMFAYEREWRLVQILPRGEASTGRIAFRDSGGLVVPYTTLALADPSLGVDILPLTSLRTGPALQNEANEDAVRLFLESRGLSPRIASSMAPLRF